MTAGIVAVGNGVGVKGNGVAQDSDCCCGACVPLAQGVPLNIGSEWWAGIGAIDYKVACGEPPFPACHEDWSDDALIPAGPGCCAGIGGQQPQVTQTERETCLRWFIPWQTLPMTAWLANYVKWEGTVGVFEIDSTFGQSNVGPAQVCALDTQNHTQESTAIEELLNVGTVTVELFNNLNWTVTFNTPGNGVSQRQVQWAAPAGECVGFRHGIDPTIFSSSCGPSMTLDGIPIPFQGTFHPNLTGLPGANIGVSCLNLANITGSNGVKRTATRRQFIEVRT